MQNLAEKNTFPRRSGRARKPKLPTPPCSPVTGARPGAGRGGTPSPPPPPPQITTAAQYCGTEEPLPPPPPTLPLPSPTVPPAPAPRPRSPAATPKRDSPATIAAGAAPGWEMFLGMKSSTVSFTSAEASKFRAAREESRSRGGSGPNPRGGLARQQQAGRRDLLNTFFHKIEANKEGEGKEEQPEKRARTRREEAGRKGRGQTSRPLASPEEKQQSLHLSRERSLKSISNWWKSSLEAGPSPPGQEEQQWGEAGEQSSAVASPRHNHRYRVL